MSSDGTPLQLRTRSERGFDEAEATLPSTSQHTTFRLPAAIQTRSAVANLLSYLGPYNPHPQPIKGGDAVWLLDNVAFRGANGGWNAEFVAAAFAQRQPAGVIETVQAIADKIGLSRDDKALATIQERLAPFTMDILPGRLVPVAFGGAHELRLGPGGRNGISSDIKDIPGAPASVLVSSSAVVPQGVDGVLDMKTLLAEPEGWGVISDIDDTIKITQTSDPVGILTSTFVSDPTPVQGMPELYAFIQGVVSAAAPFFYLSASPYNLYPFLRGFRDSFYPHGQLILRDASWMSIPGLLSNLTLGTREYKVDRMQKVHRWLPRRRMICIGDSTQSDPEAYGDIYRQFPGWIGLILIRKVTDIASLGIEAKNEPARFEAAFTGIPATAWHVFESPSECYELVRQAVSG